jgi:serine/threonine-protein kinase
MALTPGTMLGPYEILVPLGSGGMGDVYKARDPRLGRDVAIKVLPEAFARDPDRRRRFQGEARVIAALNHPHICQLYDVGPDYLVLEYIDGAPLRGPMPVDTALPIALQIASALDAAHGRGILHRDLKPGNILITEGRSGAVPRTAKLLDFGLATMMAPDEGPDDRTRTTMGTILGTAAYMSPEQAQGRPLDARSDIFSFGAVLYELVSGRRAFDGDTTADIISRVLRDDPPALQAPDWLDRVIRRCLRKDPSQRFQTMAELRAALDAISGQPAPRQPSIAVLAFENIGGDKENEYFSDGLAEEIINALTRLPGVKVIARTSAFAFKGQHGDIRRIAEALGVSTVLEGSVRRSGSRLRVTAVLITAVDGSHLWSERYDREMTDVFAIQDDIAGAIAAALRVALVSGSATHTPALRAYEALLRGRHHCQRLTPSSLVLARNYFNEAAAADPAYAAPHVELGQNLLLLAANNVLPAKDAFSMIRDEARRALEIDPSEKGPYSLLGAMASLRDYDWATAAEAFSKAMRGSTVSGYSRWLYAVFYLGPLGRHHEAVAEMRQAVEQDPLNVTWRTVLGNALGAVGGYDEALDQLRRALDIDPQNWGTHFVVAQTCMAMGDFPAAVAAAEEACAANPQHSIPSGLLAAALVRVGDTDRAAALIRQQGDAPTPLYGRVLYHLYGSEIDAAAEWWAKMIEQRELFAVQFVTSPEVRPLRESAHWPRLAALMNLGSERGPDRRGSPRASR